MPAFELARARARPARCSMRPPPGTVPLAVAFDAARAEFRRSPARAPGRHRIGAALIAGADSRAAPVAAGPRGRPDAPRASRRRRGAVHCLAAVALDARSRESVRASRRRPRPAAVAPAASRRAAGRARAPVRPGRCRTTSGPPASIEPLGAVVAVGSRRGGAAWPWPLCRPLLIGWLRVAPDRGLGGDGELVVQSRPDGARVIIDDKEHGRHAAHRAGEPGHPRAAGARRRRRAARDSADDPRRACRPPSTSSCMGVASTGVLEVRSEPSRARVTIDGQRPRLHAADAARRDARRIPGGARARRLEVRRKWCASSRAPRLSWSCRSGDGR